jgi:hypothetical protein
MRKIKFIEADNYSKDEMNRLIIDNITRIMEDLCFGENSYLEKDLEFIEIKRSVQSVEFIYRTTFNACKDEEGILQIAAINIRDLSEV